MEGNGEEVAGGAEEKRTAAGKGRVERELIKIREKVERTDARLETYEEISGAAKEKGRREEKEILEEIGEEIAAQNRADKTSDGDRPASPDEKPPVSEKGDFFTEWG